MMQTQFEHLSRGHIFTRDDKQFFVSQTISHSRLVELKDFQTGTPCMYSVQELFDGVRNGYWRYTDQNGRSPGEMADSVANANLSEKNQLELDLRQHAVSLVKKALEDGCPAMAAYTSAAMAISDKSKSGKRYSSRTVRRWVARAVTKGLTGLIPQHTCKGRKMSPESADKKDLIVKVFMETKDSPRICLKDLTDRVNLEIQRRNLQVGEVTYQQVRQVVIVQPWTHTHVARFEPKFQRAIKSFAVKSHEVRLPFSRVEMDFCKLPIFVLFGRRKTAVEVWAAIVIDVASGHLLAVVLFLSPPCAANALEAYRRACVGLSDEEFADAGIVNRLKVVGHIPKLVVDNGSEFRNEMFQNLRRLGVEIEYASAYSPYRKPFVERAIGAIKSLVNTLPGSTYNAAAPSEPEIERGKSSAVLSLSQLQNILNRFIFDDYGVREMKRHELAAVLFNDKHGLAPVERMGNLLKDFIPCPPVSDEEFRLARLVKGTKTLQKSGITHETLKYSSHELRLLFDEIGISTKGPRNIKKIEYLYDPLDIRTIFVVHPITGARLEAHLTVELSTAMTLEQFTECRKSLQAEGKSADGKAISQRFRFMIQESVQSLEKNANPKSSRSTRRSTRALEKANNSVKQPSLKTTQVSSTSPVLADPTRPSAPSLDVTRLVATPRVQRRVRDDK